MKVLMVGATGQFAGLVLPELKKRGARVRALIQDEGKKAAALKQGADEIAIGDLQDFRSLRAATEGVDGVFHINPAFAPKEGEMGAGMVEAAKSAGVRKFVFSGAIHPSISRMTNHAAKRLVEEAIYESGMTFAVLQPAMFMQTLAGAWNQIVKGGRFALPYSAEAKVCYVDYRDVAEAAALALTGDTLDYGTFELCAQGMVDRVEMAAMMSEASGRTIEAGELPFDEWAERSKMPEGPTRDGLKRMYEDYDQFGFPGGNSLVLHAILDREPRTLRAFLGELASRPQDSASQGSA